MSRGIKAVRAVARVDAASGEEAPRMPEGFSDRAAWDAIHWRFSESGCVLDEAVIGWQRDNQERVRAAMERARRDLSWEAKT